MTICIECVNFRAAKIPMGKARCSANYDVEIDLVYGEFKKYHECRLINTGGNCRDYRSK